MSRPKAVNLDTFPLYDKLHTIKQKMMWGEELTVLYPIKETSEYYVSPEVWAFCASKFRMKKKNVELKVEIPVIDNGKTVGFLEEHAWHDWVRKDKENSDTMEALNLLSKVAPDKEAVYFFELKSIISAFCWSNFSQQSNSEHTIEQQKYYTHKYYRMVDVPEIRAALLAYRDEKDEKEKEKKFHIYYDMEQDYVFKHFNLTSTFQDIGEHTVCYPVAFTYSTAEWSKEKYGKLLGYAHAGEIYFVVTKDKIFFDIERHY